MDDEKRLKPTDSELMILQVLWNSGPSTVREVMEVVEKEKPMGYTTVLKFMQIMLEKGLLSRDESSQKHVYRAAVSSDVTKHQMVGEFMDRVFEGSLKDLVVGALGGKKVTSDELDEIRELINGFEGKENV